ncbi:MAG: ABC transporter substrate-binding protein, partial [Actinomycetota bacterium]
MAAIALVAGACQGGEAGEGEGEGPIVIASANPMSGGSGYYGQTKVRGMQLALEEVNEAGGIDGRQVRLEVGDDAGDPTQGASLAQRYCSNDEILAVLGHWNSSVSLAAVPIYDRCGLPAVNDNVNRKLSGASEYSFRIFSTDILEGIALAIFSRDEGYQRAAILHDTNDYGIGLKDAYQD